MKNRSLHLLALLAIAPLSAQAASSAKLNTDFDAKNLLPGAGTDDPLKAKIGTYIGDGIGTNSVGGGIISAKTSGASIDYSDHDAAGLHAKNARNIGNIALQHAAGLGTAASA